MSAGQVGSGERTTGAVSPAQNAADQVQTLPLRAQVGVFADGVQHPPQFKFLGFTVDCGGQRLV